MKKKNQELEKFKWMLDYKIKDLRTMIEPREAEIGAMKEQVKEMDLELEVGGFERDESVSEMMGFE